MMEYPLNFNSTSFNLLFSYVYKHNVKYLCTYFGSNLK